MGYWQFKVMFHFKNSDGEYNNSTAEGKLKNIGTLTVWINITRIDCP